MPTQARGRESIDIARPAFVFALALLLANDLVLKAAYPGWATGKLSDFAGLFVLPYFLAWLWPSRRLALHVGVALAFVAWKLPLSRPFVELWNVAPWFDIARVEDLTDLVALPSVALSYIATARASRRIAHVPNIALALVALIAFTATSRSETRAPLRGTYLYPGNLAAFEDHARRAGVDVAPPGSSRGKAHGYEDGADATWLFEIDVPSGDIRPCDFHMTYDFALARFHDTLLVELRAVRGRCGFDEDQVRESARFFNRSIAGRLGLQPVRPLTSHPLTQPTEQPVP
jgi:hypothetical protein